MRLSEAIKALLIATKVEGRSPRTLETYRQKLKPLLEFLGDVEVEQITTDDLRQYVAFLMDRPTIYVGHPTHKERPGSLSPFTIASHVRAFKRLFNWLEEEGRIMINPARRIKTPHPRRKEPKGISLEDVQALLKTTRGGSPADLRDRAIILFLADTGCRVGGLCGLRITDLDMEAQTARVTEKGGKTRTVFFTSMTAGALEDWLAVRPRDRGDWVFVGMGNRSRGALTPAAVAKILKRRARVAGVKGPVNPHAFRHGFARAYLLNGGDLGSLVDLLGHSTSQVTKEHYAIFTVRELKEKHHRYSPVTQLAEMLSKESSHDQCSDCKSAGSAFAGSSPARPT